MANHIANKMDSQDKNFSLKYSWLICAVDAGCELNVATNPLVRAYSLVYLAFVGKLELRIVNNITAAGKFFYVLAEVGAYWFGLPD